MTVTQLGVSIAEASLESNVADLIFSLPIYWRAGNDYFVWPSSKSSKYEVEKEYKIFSAHDFANSTSGGVLFDFFSRKCRTSGASSYSKKLVLMEDLPQCFLIEE